MACRSKPFTTILVCLLICACPTLVGAVTPPLPAQPHEYVVDLAGVLAAGTRAGLNARLKDLEAQTTAQVVVLTVKSLDGEPIESFSHQTAVKWGIGQKGKDNGVLLTVAVKDHKYRIEVGYGLESTLPDSLVGSIGRQFLVPNFRKGDFAAGILEAVTEISNTISGGKAIGQTGEAAGGYHWQTVPRKGMGRHFNLTLILLIVFIIALLAVIRSGRKGGWDGRGFAQGFMLSMFINLILAAFGGGGGWSRGGGGGGDSGGFGGGGGGDFGGGGASGDW